MELLGPLRPVEGEAGVNTPPQIHCCCWIYPTLTGSVFCDRSRLVTTLERIWFESECVGGGTAADFILRLLSVSEEEV